MERRPDIQQGPTDICRSIPDVARAHVEAETWSMVIRIGLEVIVCLVSRLDLVCTVDLEQ